MIALQPMDASHLEQTYGWISQSSNLRAALDSIGVPSQDGNRRYWLAKWLDKTREDYAILSDRQHVGNCGLSGIDMQRRKAELWIYLGEKRGNSIGRAAVRLILLHAFGELRLNRIYIRVVETNPRALAFYLREGFTVEGVARADTIHDARPISSTHLSILSDEFDASKP